MSKSSSAEVKFSECSICIALIYRSFRLSQSRESHSWGNPFNTYLCMQFFSAFFISSYITVYTFAFASFCNRRWKTIVVTLPLPRWSVVDIWLVLTRKWYISGEKTATEIARSLTFHKIKWFKDSIFSLQAIIQINSIFMSWVVWLSTTEYFTKNNIVWNSIHCYTGCFTPCVSTLGP